MNKRPDCGYCSKKESGFTFIGGKVVCPDCLIKWNNKRIENDRRMLEDEI